MIIFRPMDIGLQFVRQVKLVWMIDAVARFASMDSEPAILGTERLLYAAGAQSYCYFFWFCDFHFVLYLT